jgi:hypothetical protein
MSTQNNIISHHPQSDIVLRVSKNMFLNQEVIENSSTCFTFSTSSFKQMEDGREGWGEEGDGSIRI